MQELHEMQRAVVRSPARFKVVRAGRRSGKTVLITEDIAYTSVSEDDSPVFYIGPTQTQARSIIWDQLKKRLAGIGDVNEQRMEIRVPTRDGGTSLIKVAGWENRENFRGQKAKKIYFDELDTMRDFWIGWQEIFRPALTDYRGGAMFCGTPKSENPNLRRLEKVAENDLDFGCFRFSSLDNPFIPSDEIEKARNELDPRVFRQEYLAEYLDSIGSLFRFGALVDVFSNTVPTGEKYLIVDVGDGHDKTIFSYWNGMEEHKREEYESMNTESIIDRIREVAALDSIPYKNIAVDAIGVGAGVASSTLLSGIIGFKSSYTAIKTDNNIVVLPYAEHTKIAPLLTDYKNLRSQCVFLLADAVNNHRIASRVHGRFKEMIIEELQTYQDVSQGDGKRMATQKDDVKSIIGRSPDHSDTWIMRMYFEVREKMSTYTSEEYSHAVEEQRMRFARSKHKMSLNSVR